MDDVEVHTSSVSNDGRNKEKRTFEEDGGSLRYVVARERPAMVHNSLFSTSKGGLRVPGPQSDPLFHHEFLPSVPLSTRR